MREAVKGIAHKKQVGFIEDISKLSFVKDFLALSQGN